MKSEQSCGLLWSTHHLACLFDQLLRAPQYILSCRSPAQCLRKADAISCLLPGAENLISQQSSQQLLPCCCSSWQQQLPSQCPLTLPALTSSRPWAKSNTWSTFIKVRQERTKYWRADDCQNVTVPQAKALGIRASTSLLFSFGDKMHGLTWRNHDLAHQSSLIGHRCGLGGSFGKAVAVKG